MDSEPEFMHSFPDFTASLDAELIDLGHSDPEPCPYLHDRPASLAYSIPLVARPTLFDRLLASGYRRNGALFYRPVCPGGCRECVPLRVPVPRFQPSRSQRKLRRKMAGVYTVEVARPDFEPGHLELFNRHARHVSAESTAITASEYREFLLQGQVETVQFTYRIGSRLAGVGFLDLGLTSASSIYFFWEPDLAEYSPGTYSVLHELEWCRHRGLDHYYLGYWIRDCPSMAYKDRFRPAERMDWAKGDWSEIESR